MANIDPALQVFARIKQWLNTAWRSVCFAYQTPIPRFMIELEMKLPKIRRVQLRPYAPDDFAACRTIHDLNAPNRFPEDSKIHHEKYLRQVPQTNLVAEIDGKVIGCGGYELQHPDYATFVFGLVHPDYQNLGIGRLLFFGRIAQLPLLEGDTMIAINTVKAALPYFKKFGFVAQPITWKDASGTEHPFAMSAINATLIRRARDYLKRVGVPYPDLRVIPAANPKGCEQWLAEQQEQLNPPTSECP